MLRTTSLSLFMAVWENFIQPADLYDDSKDVWPLPAAQPGNDFQV